MWKQIRYQFIARINVYFALWFVSPILGLVYGHIEFDLVDLVLIPLGWLPIYFLYVLWRAWREPNPPLSE